MNSKLLILFILLTYAVHLGAQGVDFKDIKSNPTIEWAATLSYYLKEPVRTNIRQKDPSFTPLQQLLDLEWLKTQKVYATKALSNKLSTARLKELLSTAKGLEHEVILYQFMYWNTTSQQLVIQPIAIGLEAHPTPKNRTSPTLFWVALNADNYNFDHKNPNISWIERQKHLISFDQLQTYKKHSDPLYLQEKLVDVLKTVPYSIYPFDMYSYKDNSTPLSQAERYKKIYIKDTIITFDPENAFGDDVSIVHDTLSKEDLNKLEFAQDLAWDSQKQAFYIKTIAVSPFSQVYNGDKGMHSALYSQKDSEWINNLKDYRLIESIVSIDLTAHNDTKKVMLLGKPTLLKSSKNWTVAQQLTNLDWLSSKHLKVYATLDNPSKTRLNRSQISAKLNIFNNNPIKKILLQQDILVNESQHQYQVTPKAIALLAPNTNDILFWIELPKTKELPLLQDEHILWAKRFFSVEKESDESIISHRYSKNRRYVSQQIIRSVKQQQLTVSRAWDSSAPIPTKEVEQIINQLDTIVTFDPETFEEIVQIVSFELDPLHGDLSGFVNDWYWDNNSQQLYVHPISLVCTRSDYDGEEIPVPLFYLNQSTKFPATQLSYFNTSLTVDGHFQEKTILAEDQVDSAFLAFPKANPLKINPKWWKKLTIYADAALTEVIPPAEAKLILESLYTKYILNKAEITFDITLSQFSSPYDFSIRPTAIRVVSVGDNKSLFWIKISHQAQSNTKLKSLGYDFQLVALDTVPTAPINRLSQNIIDHVYQHNYKVYPSWNATEQATTEYIDTMHYGQEFDIGFNPDTYEQIIAVRNFRPTLEDCKDLLFWWEWQWDKRNKELLCVPQGIAPLFLEEYMWTSGRKKEDLRKFSLYYLRNKQK